MPYWHMHWSNLLKHGLALKPFAMGSDATKAARKQECCGSAQYAAAPVILVPEVWLLGVLLRGAVVPPRVWVLKEPLPLRVGWPHLQLRLKTMIKGAT